MAELCIFPMKNLNVSQSYFKGNHVDHWKGVKPGFKDYPIDIIGMDSGRDFFYAPCECKITFIQAKDTKNFTNKLILVSTKKVLTPKYGETQVFFKVVHFEFADVKKYGLVVGKVFKKGDKICCEYKDNFSTGNHLHVSCGIGYADKSIPNNNGKYVANGDNKYPHSIMFVDTKFTKKIINAGGIDWVKI